MRLLYTDVETELRDGVRDALARRSPVQTVVARIESGQPYDRDLWHTLAVEMGLAGIAVPERFGGGGGSLREAAVVLEELGRGVAPVPYLSSAVVATTTLLACDAGDDVQAPHPAARDEFHTLLPHPATRDEFHTLLPHPATRDELASLASGRAIGVLAVPFATGPGAWSAPAVAVEDGRLSGTIAGVADGLAATRLLVPAADGLYVVDATADGVTRTPVVSLDLTRPLADLRLSGAVGRRLAASSDAAAAVDAGLTAGAALLASEQLGLAEWCLDTTVAYLKERHQFARPVGSFQALKHRLADVWVDLTQVRAVARYAAACAAEGDADLPVAASLAQAFCAPAVVHAAEECVQLHGGIGFTWEHPAHLFLKRAKANAIAFGTADRHRARLAGLADLPA